MMDGMEQWVSDALSDARVARLGTVGADGAVRMVPICFAVVDGFVVSAVDHKPKRTGQLRRFRDMTESGTATVLVDHYDDDWSTLWWVRVRGRATVHSAAATEAVSAVDALVAKYAQYRDVRPSREVFRVALDEVRWWSAAAQGGS
jgi:PPOX class probable F420-dependent enzyme